jgi:hypothetical protein
MTMDGRSFYERVDTSTDCELEDCDNEPADAARHSFQLRSRESASSHYPSCSIKDKRGPKVANDTDDVPSIAWLELASSLDEALSDDKRIHKPRRQSGLRRTHASVPQNAAQVTHDVIDKVNNITAVRVPAPLPMYDDVDESFTTIVQVQAPLHMYENEDVTNSSTAQVPASLPMYDDVDESFTKSFQVQVPLPMYDDVDESFSASVQVQAPLPVYENEDVTNSSTAQVPVPLPMYENVDLTSSAPFHAPAPLSMSDEIDHDA